MNTAAQKWIFLLVLLACVALRFAYLDRKIFWYDETFSMLEVSGYSPREATADILTGNVVTKKSLQRYQFPTADSGKTASDTVRGLISNEPQLTPAYFVVLRAWSLLFPESIAAVRALSAIFSLMALAAGFWLMREIFPESPRVAFVGAALLASSPFHLLYAQEARPYAMWSAVTLTLSALLIQAMRRRTVFGWVIYGVCAALSLYTNLLSILVLAGHALFVVLDARSRTSSIKDLISTIKGCAIALLGAVLAFAAWPYRGQHMGTGNDHYSVTRYAIKGLRSIGILFADFNVRNESVPLVLIVYGAILIALLILSAYSVYFLCRRAEKRQALFLLISIGSLIIPFLALDLLKGSSQMLVTRYLFPSLIALQITIAFLLAQLTEGSVQRLPRMLSYLVLVFILVLGLSSSVTMARAEEWWSKDPNNDLLAVSRLVNAAPNPVVVLSDTWFVPILSLEHKLRADILYQLTVEPDVPHVDPNAKAVFAIRPSSHLRDALSNCFHWDLLDAAADLWRLSPKSCDVSN